jgi:hypothetical protein
MIANNVAGWDGAGISLLDALAVNIRNNTIISNDTTASSGVLFNTLNAPLASAQGPCPYGTTVPATCHTTSEAQPAGLVAIPNSTQLTSAMAPLTVTCPTGHSNCKVVSYPLLANDVFWQNRAYYIAVGGPAAGNQPLNQQNLVTLYNGLTTTPAPNQTTTGFCTAATYWDIGVRGDTGPGSHATGNPTLVPTFSILTNSSENGGGTNDLNSNPNVVSQYCNGSRIIPEAGTAGAGWQVPPGISDATVPNPLFNLTPNATVDEGNNWVNIAWGPLTMSHPVSGATLGNYSITAGPAVDHGTAAGAPPADFFGNPRPQGNGFDIGAVELPGPSGSVTGGPVAFGSVVTGTTSPARTLVLHNTGTGPLTGITVVITAPFSRPAGAAGGNCIATLAPASTCMINVVFSPTVAGPAAGTVTITASVPVPGSPVALTGTGVAPVVAATLTPTAFNFGNVTRGATPASAFHVFLLTNTGNVALTGITSPTISLNPTDFGVPTAGLAGLLTTCGTGNPLPALRVTTLAVGASCIIDAQFHPPTADTIGLKSGTLRITDLAGAQTSALTGTAQ